MTGGEARGLDDPVQSHYKLQGIVVVNLTAKPIIGVLRLAQVGVIHIAANG